LRIWSVCAGICLIAPGAAGQTFLDSKEIDVHSTVYVPRLPGALKVDATLVETDVVVRDGRGRAVAGLKKENFEIRDEGKKREIRLFSAATAVHADAAAPGAGASSGATPTKAGAARARWIGLLFDDLNSAAGDLISARAAAVRFLKEGLQPGDHVAVFTTFGRQVLAFTTDTAAITEALNKLSPHPMTPQPGFCPSLTSYEAYLIYSRQDPGVLPVKVEEARRCSNQPPARGRRGSSDAVDDSSPDPVVQQVVQQASQIWQQVELNSRNTLYAFRDIVDYMGRLQGDRLVLAASSGFLSGTLLMEQDELVNRALHAGVVIDALDAKGLYTQTPVESVAGMTVRSAIMQASMGTRPQMVANDALANLAYSTGGIFFHNNNDLTAGIREMMAPEVTYQMGFAPDETPNGKYHKIKVTVNPGKGMDVQFRPGYMALAPKVEERAAPRRIDEEVLAAEDHHDAPVKFAVTMNEGEGPNVSSVLHVDLKNLTFKEAFGVHSQKLIFISALMDPQGNFVSGEESAIDLALKDATLKQYLEGGLNLATKLQVPKGSYRLREVLQVAGDGKITSATLPVEVH
jgi:VWFA-related protein